MLIFVYGVHLFSGIRGAGGRPPPAVFPCLKSFPFSEIFIVENYYFLFFAHNIFITYISYLYKFDLKFYATFRV